MSIKSKEKEKNGRKRCVSFILFDIFKPALFKISPINENFVKEYKILAKETQEIQKSITKRKKKSQKEQMIDNLFEKKKFFGKKIKYFETECSPEKKYYRNKNIEKFWKDLNEKKEKINENKKKEIEEKKNKLKKYEKMKIKKREISVKSNENQIFEPDFEELFEKINQQKNDLALVLSKITIKTFLVNFLLFFDN